VVYIDNDFPIKLGMELHRPDAQYIAKYVMRPVVKHDFTKEAGDTIQLDRYKYWSDVSASGYTKDNRRRADTETIGTNNYRGIPKEKVILRLEEYTGPSDINNPNSPSTFQVPLRNLRWSQRPILDINNPMAWTNTIGSQNLLQDFKRWEDSVLIQEYLQTSYTYNPDGVADGGSYDLATNGYGGQPPKIKVSDIEEIVTTLGSRGRLAPPFEDGNYGALVTPRFMKDLRRDPEFLEITRYTGSVGYDRIPVDAMQLNPSGSGLTVPYGADGTTNVWKAGNLAGQLLVAGQTPTMPVGFAFAGCRFFESNNIDTESVTLTYTNPDAGITSGSASRNAELGIFYGQEAVGVGIGGVNGPEILINNNSDFNRFLILIWRMYGAWEMLDERFITVARSYQS
jgi:hypothetical protein